MGNNSIFEFDSITKNGIKLDNEIYIRKILKNKLLKDESISTFAKIESEYEILKGNKNESNGKIQITIPKINANNYTFSILVDIPDENEKYVISNKVDKIKPTPPDETDKPDEPDISLILKIVIPIAGVILIVGIVLIIVLCIKKKKGGELKQNIMKTSFKDEDSNDDCLIRAEEDD